MHQGWSFRAILILAVSASAAEAQLTWRVSVSSSGEEGNGLSCALEGPLSISPDGRFVAFESEATNLVPGDFNGRQDVFVHDRQTQETFRVSVASDGQEGNGGSFSHAMSVDGRFVAFGSLASNLVPNDSNGWADVFVHDRLTGETTRVSVDSSGAQAIEGVPPGDPSISADGRYVAFLSSAGNLVPGDTNNDWDVFVHDRLTGETTRVSVSSTGQQANGSSLEPVITPDGRYVAFESYASNLVEGDTNICGQFSFPCADVFVHDRLTGETVRVSVASDGAQANNRSTRPSISADGRFVAFESFATNLVPNDSPFLDIFVHDRLTGITLKASVTSEGVPANNASSWASISADGRLVAFNSAAPNLIGDNTGRPEIFVHDLITGQTGRVSVSITGAPDDGSGTRPTISATGRYVTFASAASTLVPGDMNSQWDVFVRDQGGADLTAVLPSSGPLEGGEYAHVLGSGFLTDGSTTVRFGSTPAEVLETTPTRITVRTPAGMGTVGVTVGDRRAWSGSLESAYTYLDPPIAVRHGNVNVGRGDRENVLLVNAQSGSESSREMSVGLGEAIQVVMIAPSSRAQSLFALYVWRGSPTAATMRDQPAGVGRMVFPTPLNPGQSPQPFRIANNFADPRPGVPNVPSSPAPTIVGTLASGFSRPVTVTLQGLIQDNGSQIPQRVSVTNAVILHVGP